MNKFTLCGKVSQKPKLYATPSLDNFSWLVIAVRRASKDSKNKFDIDYIKCEVWGMMAEKICKDLNVNDLIIIQGHIKTTKEYNHVINHNEQKINLIVDYIEMIARFKGN